MIAVGERLFTRWAFRDVLENGWAAIVQPDCANAGGISEMVRIAALAEMYGGRADRVEVMRHGRRIARFIRETMTMESIVGAIVTEPPA